MLTDYQGLMIKHGLIIMLLGLVGGFLFMFSLVGAISFSPLPFEIDYELPGSSDRWRAVHVGNIMNGMMAIVFAFVIGSIDIEKQAKKIIAYGTVATIWGNANFYIVGVLAPNHGITLGDNRLGESNWAGVVAFIPAYIVALVLIYVVVTLIKAVDKQTGN